MPPDPCGFGWKRGDDGLEIQWNSCNPAPDELIDLLSCSCSGDCKEDSCPCIRNKLPCTDACHSFSCHNPHENDFDDFSDEDNDDDYEYDDRD